jgi:hyperosmotically inducible periplasmic protein
MRKTSVLFVLLIAVAVVLWTCQTPTGRSAGQGMDDGTITNEVKARLLKDNITKGLVVSVVTVEGQVTLNGAVDTAQQRETAMQIASNVKGVRKVNNRIYLKKGWLQPPP